MLFTTTGKVKFMFKAKAKAVVVDHDGIRNQLPCHPPIDFLCIILRLVYSIVGDERKRGDEALGGTNLLRLFGNFRCILK